MLTRPGAVWQVEDIKGGEGKQVRIHIHMYIFKYPIFTVHSQVVHISLPRTAVGSLFDDLLH